MTNGDHQFDLRRMWYKLRVDERGEDIDGAKICYRMRLGGTEMENDLEIYGSCGPIMFFHNYIILERPWFGIGLKK